MMIKEYVIVQADGARVRVTHAILLARVIQELQFGAKKKITIEIVNRDLSPEGV